jgi:hypothetical protein
VKKMDKVDGTDTDKSERIRLEFLHGSRKPSLGFQVLPTIFYLQGWMPRDLDQLGGGLSMKLRTV